MDVGKQQGVNHVSITSYCVKYSDGKEQTFVD